jgi:hypothetical protein
MGLDLSERRLCERRCLALLDDMSKATARSCSRSSSRSDAFECKAR